MMESRVKFGWMTIVAACLFVASIAQANDSPAPSDVGSIRRYLLQFKPSAERDKEISALIEQLGASAFTEREAAMMKLSQLAVTPRRLLNKALKHDDAEIRLRARQLLERAGDDDVQRLQAVLSTITRDKLKGLAADLIPALEHASSFRRSAVRAMTATSSAKDAEVLKAALQSDVSIVREAALTAVAEHLPAQSAHSAKQLLKDDDERVVLAAARILANQGDRACLAALIRLLEADAFEVRLASLRILRFVSSKKFGYSADRDRNEPATKKAIEAWEKWAGTEGAKAKLRFPLKLDDVIQLFNGVDLAGWQPVITGVALKETDVWQVKDGKIICNGNGNGYLRTKRKHVNYKLTVDYRWPGQGGDSGVWIMMPGPDARTPVGLEVQLLNDKAGDFWALGGFTCQVRGQRLSGYGPKLAASSEKKLGEWNTCELTLLNGKLTVKINGVEQNNATDCPKTPGHIALQVEGDAIEFRRVELQPLGD